MDKQLSYKTFQPLSFRSLVRLSTIHCIIGKLSAIIQTLPAHMKCVHFLSSVVIAPSSETLQSVVQPQPDSIHNGTRVARIHFITHFHICGPSTEPWAKHLLSRKGSTPLPGKVVVTFKSKFADWTATITLAGHFANCIAATQRSCPI